MDTVKEGTELKATHPKRERGGGLKAVNSFLRQEHGDDCPFTLALTRVFEDGILPRRSMCLLCPCVFGVCQKHDHKLIRLKKQCCAFFYFSFFN